MMLKTYIYFISYQYYYGPCGEPYDYGNTVVTRNKPIETHEDIKDIEATLEGCDRVVILNVSLLRGEI